MTPDSVVPALELYGGQSIDPERDLIVINEVQLAPRALTSLKYFSEQEPQYAVCAAGSLLGLSGSTSAYPVGKVTQRTLFPLSFREYLAAVEPRLHEYLIDWLITTGLVHRVPVVQDGRAPLAAHVRESIFKLYLLDIGLLHSMLAVPPFDVFNQSWGAYRGYVAENFVATELRAHGHDSLYAWKGTSAEVEFILEIDGAVVPIEVKAGKNTRRAKSLQVFRDTYRPPVAVKVSTRNFAFDGAVAHVPLYATGFVADILRRL